MKKMRWLALVLATIMLFAGCSKGKDPTKQKYSEMEYVRPDVEKIQTMAQELCQLGETGTDAEEIYEKYIAFDDACQWFDTMYTLADIRYAIDLSDTFYEEEYNYLVEQSADIYSTWDEVCAALAANPLVDELESEDYLGDGYFDAYKAPEGSGDDWEYESAWGEAYTELYNQEQNLLAEYYSAQESLSELQYSDPEDYETAKEKMGPILVSLIQVRQEIAAELGYDSYEDYVMTEVYNRRSTSEDVERHGELICKYLVPLNEKSNMSSFWSTNVQMSSDPEDCLSYVESAAKNMGGVVAEAFKEMERRELYDVSASATKAEGSFEIFLNKYNAPFIVVNLTGDESDRLTTAHEFGHFANDFASGVTNASSDVCEILSQAMEYLSLRYNTSLEPEVRENLEKISMLYSLSGFVDQMANQVFEHRIYQLTGDELTVDNICKIYSEVSVEFGYEDVGYHPAGWVTVPHYFQWPFYSYGYVVSNDAAMQIFAMERENEGTGLDVYTRLLSENEAMPIEDYMEKYHMADPLDENHVKELAEMIEEIAGSALE